MIHARFASGEEGFAVALDGLLLDVVSSGAHAPGRPVEVVLELPDGPLPLRAKSRGSRRREDGRFDVRLRLVELRREERARLEPALVAG